MRMIITILFLAVVGVCHAGEKAFRFPLGDVEEGKEAFVRLACNQCHSTNSSTVKKGELRSSYLDIKLADEKGFVKNYLNIVTAITDPQHVTDEKYAKLFPELYPKGSISSVMPSMIDKMSARDLMNLVKYIDSLYQETKFYETTSKTNEKK